MSQVNYIHVVEVTRENLCMVIGLPEVVKDFVEVHKGEMPTVYYDTTFNMGDFYISTLLYRHSLFEGCPVIPLLMLVHERHTTESHQLLFNWFVWLTGITNNVSQSYNRVLKDFQNWKVWYNFVLSNM